MTNGPEFDSYRSLTAQAYDLSRPSPPRREFALYESYVAEASGPILEPMCGTGAYLLRFLQQRKDVHGFDASRPMLDVLETKAASLNLVVEGRVHQSTIDAFVPTSEYALLYIPTGSFGLIIGVDEACAALKKFYDCLAPGGRLVFNIDTPQTAPQTFGYWTGETFRTPGGQTLISSMLQLGLKDDVATAITKLELVDRGSIVRAEVEDFCARYYEVAQMSDMLRAAGFTQVKALKAFDRHCEADADAGVVVFECTKSV